MISKEFRSNWKNRHRIDENLLFHGFHRRDRGKKRKNKEGETTVPFKVVLNVYQGSITAVEDKGVSMRVSELNEEKFQ